MSKALQKSLIKLGAALLAALMLAPMLAAPLGALAMELDTTTLPVVTLEYQLAEDGERQTLPVTPGVDAMQQPVYWATLPQEAFFFPITLSVVSPLDDGTFVYSPEMGATLNPEQAIDFMGYSTLIDITMGDGTPVGSYALYLSTVPMPVETVQNGMVYISYVDETTGTELDSDMQERAPGTYTFQADLKDSIAGYVLSGPGSVDVTVYEDGTVEPSPVQFFMKPNEPEPEPEPVTGYIIIHYIDQNGDVVLDASGDYKLGSHWIQPDRMNELPGYTLTDGEAVEATVYDDGSVSPEKIEFTVSLPQEPETPDEPVNVKVPVLYMDADDNLLIDDSRTYEPGEYSVAPTRAGELSGYTPYSTDAVPVTVYADGTVVPDTVVFLMVRDEQGGGDEGGEQPKEPEQPQEPEQPDPSKEEGPTEPTLTPINLYGITTDVVNFRDAPSTKGTKKLFANVKKDTTAWVTGSIVNDAGDTWYFVNYQGQDCYVSGDYFAVLSQEDSDRIYYANQPPVQVEVSYIDDTTGAAFYQEFVSCKVNDKTQISVKWDQAAGYTLLDESETVVVDVSRESVADPSSVTFRFSKTPVQADVYFSYVLNGEEFAHETVTLSGEGDQPVAPNASLVPDESYKLESASAQSVHIDQNGADPDTVIFTYTKPVSAKVTFRYIGSDERVLYEDRVESFAQGSTDTSPYAVAAPEGYAYFGVSSAQIDVSEKGVATPDAVTFTYEKLAISANVTFRYVDADGDPVASERTEPIGEGPHSSSSYAIGVPEGYRYIGVSAESFEITAKGASPDTITFTYEKLPEDKKLGTVRVDYLSVADGSSVAPSQDFELEPNTYDVDRFLIATPQGYNDPTVSARQVVISPDGKADPDSVQFTFTPVDVPVVTADVTFRYVDEGGKKLEDDLVMPLEVGAHDSGEYAAEPDGYTLKSASADTVTVSPNGKAEPASVTFTYAVKRSTATVEVHYANAFGVDFPGSPISVELPVGTPTIQASENERAIVPAGYTLSTGSKSAYTVTVDENLVADPASITFNYYEAGLTATVDVYYVDSTTGERRATESVPLTPGTQQIKPNRNALPQGYELSDVNPEYAEIRVSETGEASPAMWQFYCQPIESENYIGYAVTTQQTALRNAYNNSDSSIVETLPTNTLLYLNVQQTVGSTVWSGASVVLGDTKNSGVVLYSATRQITRAEADRLIKQYEQAHPTAPDEPEQDDGFYITKYPNVPLRSHADPSAYAQYLDIDTVVYVSGQLYPDEQGWHSVNYDGSLGYIRISQLRKMSAAEVEAYMSNTGKKEPTETKTAAPYDPYAKSSYGYVTSSTVNFRETPNGTRIKTLNKYAFALVLGSKEVNGVTWYNVNQSGVIGWIHGTYFHQLNLTELTSFLNSDEYKQGLLGNSASSGGSSSSGSGNSGNQSSGSAKPGNPISVEDWNVGTWQNTGVTAQTSYAPFNPYATASATVSTSPSTTPEPTATLVIGTMIPITYDDESRETQTSTVPWGLMLGAVALIGGAGGVYAYALNQNKKRKAAARAAASRRAGATAAGKTAGTAGAASVVSAAGNKQASASSGASSPYTRRAVAAPPIAGWQDDSAQTPGTGMVNPYSSGSITGDSGTEDRAGNPYAAPIAPYAPIAGERDDAYTAPAADDYASDPYAASTAPYAPVVDDGYEPTDLPDESASPYVSPYNAGATSGLRSAGDLRRPGDAWTGEREQPTNASFGSAGYATEAPDATQAPRPAASSNPYVRPLGMPGAGTTDGQAPTQPATPRRATRMQRYHAAEGDEGQDRE